MRSPARRDPVPEAGFSYLECILCTSVMTLLLGALFVGLAGNSKAVGDSLDDAAAGRAAASRLEVLRAGRVAATPGTRSFEPDAGAVRILPGLRGEEEIREAGPGLLAVEVRLRWKGAGEEERSASLRTLLAREGGR
jgi:hypothetical protein